MACFEKTKTREQITQICNFWIKEGINFGWWSGLAVRLCHWLMRNLNEIDSQLAWSVGRQPLLTILTTWGEIQCHSRVHFWTAVSYSVSRNAYISLSCLPLTQQQWNCVQGGHKPARSHFCAVMTMTLHCADRKSDIGNSISGSNYQLKVEKWLSFLHMCSEEMAKSGPKHPSNYKSFMSLRNYKHDELKSMVKF